MDPVGTVEVSGDYIRFQIPVAGEPVWFLTHAYPHADEILAAMLIGDFGTAEFVAKYARHGVIRVGVMHDVFDEHHVAGAIKQQGECATTLVAKALGVSEQPGLATILEYVRRIDTEGRDDPQGLGVLIKKMHAANRQHTKYVINWALLAMIMKIGQKDPSDSDFRRDKIITLLDEAAADKEMSAVYTWWRQGLEMAEEFQRQTFAAAQAELVSKARVLDITGPDKRRLKVIIIESDNDEVSKAARAAGSDADLVVQRRSSGNVHIFTSRRANLKLFNLARVLRLEEQRARGQVVETDWYKLQDEGMCPLRVWYFHHRGQFLLNGSLTAQNVSPTALSLDRIVEIVQIAVNPTGFEPSRQAFCQIGQCTSTIHDPCPWYSWGLNWCRDVRRGEQQRGGSTGSP